MTSLRGLTFCLALAASLLIGAVPIATATSGTPVELYVSQGVAFAVLGHSCGGIQEASVAAGFDATTGDPTGVVSLKTRCGGSGRGGGYHTTTYTGAVTAMWDLGGNLVSYVTGATVTTDPTATYTDSAGDQLYTSGSYAWLLAVLPNAPTDVQATVAGGQWTVSWTPDPATAAIISRSTITATPEGGTAVIVSPVSGNATSALVGALAPLTTYDITVTNTDAAGTSAPSDPIQITTGAATTKPGVPKLTSVSWLGAGLLSVTWTAPSKTGDSPIDSYQVRVKPHDADSGAPPAFTTTFSGSTLDGQVAVDDTWDWAVRIRAHNATGWGSWSTWHVIGAFN